MLIMEDLGDSPTVSSVRVSVDETRVEYLFGKHSDQLVRGLRTRNAVSFSVTEVKVQGQCFDSRLSDSVLVV